VAGEGQEVTIPRGRGYAGCGGSLVTSHPAGPACYVRSGVNGAAAPAGKRLPLVLPDPPGRHPILGRRHRLDGEVTNSNIASRSTSRLP
jgi:hypothetical protein